MRTFSYCRNCGHLIELRRIALNEQGKEVNWSERVGETVRDLPSRYVALSERTARWALVTTGIGASGGPTPGGPEPIHIEMLIAKVKNPKPELKQLKGA